MDHQIGKLCIELSSGLLQHAATLVFTDVPKVLAAFMFQAMRKPRTRNRFVVRKQVEKCTIRKREKELMGEGWTTDWSQ
jgi:hypothetical protein